MKAQHDLREILIHVIKPASNRYLRAAYATSYSRSLRHSADIADDVCHTFCNTYFSRKGYTHIGSFSSFSVLSLSRASQYGLLTPPF